MQFILSAVTPKLFVNQHPQPVRSWGLQVIPLPQGRYYVTAAFPYMGSDMTGRADLMVDVYANHATRLKYESPFFMWSSGTLLNVGTTPIQQAPSGWGR